MDPIYLYTSLHIVYLITIIHLWTEVKAMQKSTHKIEYVDPWKEFTDEKPPEEKDIFENMN